MEAHKNKGEMAMKQIDTSPKIKIDILQIFKTTQTYSMRI